MDSMEPILTQYKLFSERKLHFGKLFWQIPAVFLALLVAVVGITKEIRPPLLWWSLVVAGLLATEIAYISHRLRQNEDYYEGLMKNIEVTFQEQFGTAVQIAPTSKKYGSRFAVTVSFLVFGVLLTSYGLFKLA